VDLKQLFFNLYKSGKQKFVKDTGIYIGMQLSTVMVMVCSVTITSQIDIAANHSLHAHIGPFTQPKMKELTRLIA
jgi:hypothetical protein